MNYVALAMAAVLGFGAGAGALYAANGSDRQKFMIKIDYDDDPNGKACKDENYGKAPCLAIDVKLPGGGNPNRDDRFDWNTIPEGARYQKVEFEVYLYEGSTKSTVCKWIGGQKVCWTT